LKNAQDDESGSSLQQLIEDCCRKLHVPFRFDPTGIFQKKISSLLKHLNSMPSVRNAVAAQLTDGIPLKEACSITGLSCSQLDRGHQTLKDFHLSQFLSSVSYKLFFCFEIFTTNHILLFEKN
jgi:hypothetical protein